MPKDSSSPKAARPKPHPLLKGLTRNDLYDFLETVVVTLWHLPRGFTAHGPQQEPQYQRNKDLKIVPLRAVVQEIPGWESRIEPLRTRVLDERKAQKEADKVAKKVAKALAKGELSHSPKAPCSTLVAESEIKPSS